MKRTIISILLVTVSVMALAQKNISIKGFGLTTDLWEYRNPDLMLTKLDDKAMLLKEPGAVLTYEFYSGFNELISFGISQGMFQDATQQWSWFTHVGLRRKFYQHWKHSFTVGVGPTVHYWQSRKEMEGYVAVETVYGNEFTEYKVSWMSLDLEYNYAFNKHHDLSVAFVNVHPKAYTLAVGYTYWISRKQRKNCDCPGTGRYKRR